MSLDHRQTLALLLAVRAELLAPLDQRIDVLRAAIQAEEDALLLADSDVAPWQLRALLDYTGDWNQGHIGAGLTVDQTIDDPRNEPGYYIRVALTPRGQAIRAALQRQRATP